MSTIDSEKASQLRARILNTANRFIEAHRLMSGGYIKEARVIIYDLDRFEVRSIYHEVVDLEFEQMKEKKE